MNCRCDSASRSDGGFEMHRSLARVAPLFAGLFLLLNAGAGAATMPGAVESSLVADIRQAQRQLTEAEARIAGDAAALAKRIDARESTLVRLRADAAVARRLADEQTLSLDALEQRIERWRDQEAFQKSLFITFAERRSAGAGAAREILGDMADGRRLADAALADIEGALAPEFRRTQAALADGRVVELDALSLGPLRWYWHQGEGGSLSADFRIDGAGLQDDGFPHAATRFSGSLEAGLAKLWETGAANLAVDPSIDRVARIRNGESLWQHLARGGVWVVPILAFALLATAIGIGKCVQFARLPRIRPLGPSFTAGASGSNVNLQRLAAGLRGPQRALVRAAMENASGERRDDALFALLLDQRQRLERFLGALAVTATVSPLLGLLGTVSGMISTFNLMTLFGAGDPAAVSGGISEALVTTEMGLVVAIPALIMHALLSRKAASYNQRLEACAVELSKLETARG